MKQATQPSVLHVARKIVELTDDTLTPLKLQKLAYYCQAWNLVWRERPMFDEDFQAWSNGPVNPELFDRHRGTFRIRRDFLSEFSDFQFCREDLATVQSIISFYGKRDPFYLSELTHKERPWREARGNTPLGEPSTAVITKQSMQDYYAGISSAKNE